MESGTGEQRHFHIYVPQRVPAAPDVLLFFHGFDGQGRRDCEAVKAHEKAETLGFVAVCPDALGSPLQLARSCVHSPECHPSGHDIAVGSAEQDWSLNNTTGRYWRAYPHGGYSLWWNRHLLGTPDDGPQDALWAVDELLPWVLARVHILGVGGDPRVFVSGLSLGAAMAFRVACEHTEKFAGLLIANEAFLDPDTGWGPEASGFPPTCRLPRTFRSWQAQSDNDFWYGLEDKGRMSYELGWRDFTTRAMGCAGRSIEVWRSPTGNVTCEEYPGCAARLCRYHALGHDPAFILLKDRELKGWEAGWKYITAR